MMRLALQVPNFTYPGVEDGDLDQGLDTVVVDIPAAARSPRVVARGGEILTKAPG